jgi:hypothetical protein
LNEPPEVQAININRTRSFYGLKDMEKAEGKGDFPMTLFIYKTDRKGAGTLKRLTKTLRGRKKVPMDFAEEPEEKGMQDPVVKVMNSETSTLETDDSLWRKIGRNARTMVVTDREELSKMFSIFKAEQAQSSPLTSSAPNIESAHVSTFEGM